MDHLIFGHSPTCYSAGMSTRPLALLLFVLVFPTLLTLVAAQTEEVFYDSQFPRDSARNEAASILIVSGQGSLGDSPIRQEFSITW